MFTNNNCAQLDTTGQHIKTKNLQSAQYIALLALSSTLRGQRPADCEDVSVEAGLSERLLTSSLLSAPWDSHTEGGQRVPGYQTMESVRRYI